MIAHAQKPDLVFQRNGRVHLNRRGCQFSRLLADEECRSADSNCIDRVPTYSATHYIRIFPLHFPSRASPCAIRFRTRYTTADAHTSADSSLLNWSPCRFKWTRPFCRKTKSCFCACAITFQLACTVPSYALYYTFMVYCEWKCHGLKQK